MQVLRKVAILFCFLFVFPFGLPFEKIAFAFSFTIEDLEKRINTIEAIPHKSSKQWLHLGKAYLNLAVLTEKDPIQSHAYLQKVVQPLLQSQRDFPYDSALTLATTYFGMGKHRTGLAKLIHLNEAENLLLSIPETEQMHLFIRLSKKWQLANIHFEQAREHHQLGLFSEMHERCARSQEAFNQTLPLLKTLSHVMKTDPTKITQGYDLQGINPLNFQPMILKAHIKFLVWYLEASKGIQKGELRIQLFSKTKEVIANTEFFKKYEAYNAIFTPSFISEINTKMNQLEQELKWLEWLNLKSTSEVAPLTPLMSDLD